MTNITAMRRNTSQTWLVYLLCGHETVIRKEDLDRLQWYIGRRVECPECKGNPHAS
jgi:hypothetical protein